MVVVCLVSCGAEGWPGQCAYCHDFLNPGPNFELTHTNEAADSLVLINTEAEDMDVFTSISLANLLRCNRKRL